jgi:hypothetical protein
VPIEARWLRRYEDGAAVFDPVTWQTHVLSDEGFALLVVVLDVARACAGEPEAVRARLAAELDPTEDLSAMTTWIRLACHLVQGQAVS